MIFGHIIKKLGSLKLAVVLISVITCVLIAATLVEAKYSTELAVNLFYGSWWFSSLLFLLSLNVISSALVRYPWSRRQYGFLMTHSGIVIILIGAIVGLLGGREGYITLSENGPAVDSLTTGREVLQIGRSGEKSFLRIPLDLDRIKKSSAPIRISSESILPPETLQASIVSRYAHTEDRTVVSPGETGFNPALEISIRPPMADEVDDIREWMVCNDPERQILQMGPLFIRLMKAETEEKLQALLNPPPVSETGGLGKLNFKVEGVPFELNVHQWLGKEMKSEDGKITIALKEYFADFRMDEEEEKPVSASDEPNNPAIRYEVSWGEEAAPKKAVGFAFADYPDLAMIHVEGAQEKAVETVYDFDRSMMDVGIFAENSVVFLIAGPGDKLHYAARRPGEERRSGPVELGKILPLEGWKMNPGLSVAQYLQNAEVRQVVTPIPLEEGSGFSRPALELQLTGGGHSTNVVIQWNRPFEVMAGADPTNRVPVTLLYTDEKIPLGFKVQLLKFNMPTFEGTQMPASYESLVRVTDQETGDALERKVWMNHPMSYGGYRISQSGYSQGMGTTRSTLQLLADPGSWLKWLGSILLMVGITVMYFWEPDRKKKSSVGNPNKETDQSTAE